MKLLLSFLLLVCLSGRSLAANCDTPLNATLQSFAGGTANFTWSAVSGATDYEYVVDQISTDPLSGTMTTSTSCSVSGLISSTQYYFHLRTKCGTDSSAWAIVPFLTPVCPTVAQVNTIQGVSSTTANLAWGPANMGDKFMYGVNTTQNPPNPGTYVQWTPVITVSGLTPNTSYYVCVRRICGVGDTSAWYCSYSFTTDPFPADVQALNKDDISLQVYPNPALSSVTISTQGKKTDAVSLQLLDVAGRIITSYSFETTEINIDVSSLAPGIYFIRYSDDKHRHVEKLIKE